jgi:integrase/recombinase XerD
MKITGSAINNEQTLESAALKLLGVTRKYSPATLERYQRTWGQFVAYLKAQGLDNDVRSFTDEHIQAFTDGVLAAGIGPNTVVTMLHALSTLAEVGLQAKVGGKFALQRNPTKGFEWPVYEPKETAYLLPAELRAFYAVELEPRERLARDLLIETGLRASELCRANVEDLHVVVGKAYLGVIVKGRRSRQRHYDMPISDPLAHQIVDVLQVDGRWPITGGPGEATPLLIDRVGDRYNRLQLTKLMIRIGHHAGITRLSTSAHKVRHTLEVIRRLGKVDPSARSRLMGHANLSSLQRYDHLVPDELHEARRQQIESFKRYIGEFRPAEAEQDAERLSREGKDRRDA